MSVTPNDNFASGYLVGTGAAINVSLGWTPSRVDVFNLTDGDIVTFGLLDVMIQFTSGGTNTPVANQKITGITSGAVAKIKQVVLISGTYAGGDAAGFFVCDKTDVVGTFQSENVTLDTSASATDDATVVAQVEIGMKVDTAVATVTTTSLVTSYVGDSTHGKGFTIGSVVSESAKFLRWFAWR